MGSRGEYKMTHDKYLFRLKWTLIIIFFLTMFIGLDLTHVWYHEHAHAAIFDAYGVDYTYGWQFQGMILQFYVQANDTSKCNETCMALQMESEIYTYNLAWIFYSLWMMLFIYLIKCFFDDVDKIKKETP